MTHEETNSIIIHGSDDVNVSNHDPLPVRDEEMNNEHEKHQEPPVDSEMFEDVSSSEEGDDDDDDEGVTITLYNGTQNAEDVENFIESNDCENLKIVDALNKKWNKLESCTTVYATNYTDLCGPEQLSDDDLKLYKKIRPEWLMSENSDSETTVLMRNKYITRMNRGIEDFHKKMKNQPITDYSVVFVVFSYVSKLNRKNSIIRGPKEMVVVECDFDSSLSKIVKITNYANVTSSNRRVYSGVESILNKAKLIYVYRHIDFVNNYAFPWFECFQKNMDKIFKYTKELKNVNIMCPELSNHSHNSCAHCIMYIFLKNIVPLFNETDAQRVHPQRNTETFDDMLVIHNDVLFHEYECDEEKGKKSGNSNTNKYINNALHEKVFNNRYHRNSMKRDYHNYPFTGDSSWKRTNRFRYNKRGDGRVRGGGGGRSAF